MTHFSSLPGRKPSNTSLYFPRPTFRSTSYPSCSLKANAQTTQYQDELSRTKSGDSVVSSSSVPYPHWISSDS